MKPREPRRKVLIEARLRQDRGWSSARILNLSPRGVCASAPQAPPRGSYIEICRGTHRIVARVVWVKDDQFGVRAQDVIAVESIIKGLEPPPAAANPDNDRRFDLRQPTSEEQHEHSRRWSRRLEFAAVTAFACAAAFLAFDTVRETLSKPLRQVEASLGATG